MDGLRKTSSGFLRGTISIFQVNALDKQDRAGAKVPISEEQVPSRLGIFQEKK